MAKGLVRKIIGQSTVDGPGNRTAVFMQGCNIRCAYCHNPETQALHDPEAHEMEVEEVLAEVRKGIPFIRGITVSGGECMLQAEWVTELFVEVKALAVETGHDLSCLIDTNGTIPFAAYPELMKVCDGVMLDVKAYNKEFSDWLIRYPNDVVLKNLDHLLATGKLEEVRTLIFPDRDKENEATVRYVAETIKDRCRYKIIRYRQFGVREEYRKELGDFTTGEDYAMRYVELARSLGASKAILV